MKDGLVILHSNKMQGGPKLLSAFQRTKRGTYLFIVFYEGQLKTVLHRNVQ